MGCEVRFDGDGGVKEGQFSREFIEQWVKPDIFRDFCSSMACQTRKFKRRRQGQNLCTKGSSKSRG
jgi:hypothetical protein